MPYIDFVRSRVFTPLALESARFKSATEVVAKAIAAGEDQPDVVAGVPGRLPLLVRTRLAEVLRSSSEWISLGEERLTERHFNLDPALSRIRWYRVAGPSGRRYLTVRLNVEGKVMAC